MGDGDEEEITPLVSPLMGGFRRRKHGQNSVINREDGMCRLLPVRSSSGTEESGRDK